MLNSASRSRSAVGRIACDFGAASTRPRSRPPTMRISASCRARGRRPRRFSRRARSGSPMRSVVAAAFAFAALDVRALSFPVTLTLLGLLGRASTDAAASRPRPSRRARGAHLRMTGRDALAELPLHDRRRKIRAGRGATRSPSCSRKVRVLTSSIAPSASSPSWNGPNDTRISRFTARPRWPSTFFTSRFLPSRMAKVSQTLLPCARSTVASIDP